jgi:hypothetical protein
MLKVLVKLHSSVIINSSSEMPHRSGHIPKKNIHPFAHSLATGINLVYN